MKPFLLLATRAEEVPADEEYSLFLRFTGLSARDFDRQVAEFQVRVAVLNGFTALGTPITEVEA